MCLVATGYDSLKVLFYTERRTSKYCECHQRYQPSLNCLDFSIHQVNHSSIWSCKSQWIRHYPNVALDLIIQEPCPPVQVPGANPHLSLYWTPAFPLLPGMSNLFNMKHTFGRWAVGILLECFLVHYRISSHKCSFYVNARVLSVIYVLLTV